MLLDRVDRSSRVGTRVAVRLRARGRCEDMPHQRIEDGVRGTVVRCTELLGGRSHTCLVRLDRAVAWPTETRRGRVDIPLEARFFAPDELEPVDATAPPPEAGRAPDTGRLLTVLRNVLAPRLVAAGFALEEAVTGDEIGCLEYRAGPPADPLALAITHVREASTLRAELWRPRRLFSVAKHGWYLHEETWRLVPDAEPDGLACLVDAAIGRWMDLDRWIDDLRTRLECGDLAAIGPIDLGDGTGHLPGETTITVMLADLDHLDRLPPGALGCDEQRARQTALLRDFRRLRELLG